MILPIEKQHHNNGLEFLWTTFIFVVVNLILNNFCARLGSFSKTYFNDSGGDPFSGHHTLRLGCTRNVRVSSRSSLSMQWK